MLNTQEWQRGFQLDVEVLLEGGQLNNRNNELQAKANRQHKDQVFRMIYKDRYNFLELYNALNETTYDNPDELEITTLENAVYLGMKNDVSYLLYEQLAVYEHQSTINPNMPLRDLFYVSHIYSKLTRDNNLFSSELINIPAPQFVVFYNGTDKTPEEYELKLSEAYGKYSEEPGLELKVKVLNINYGHNKELMDKCKSLRDYAIFVAKIRDYRKCMPLTEALELAITECIKEDVMRDFLIQQRAEVFSMCLFEFSEEEYRKCLREEAQRQGLKEGIAQGIAQGITQGITQGIAQGLEKGKFSEQIRLVRSKMNKGMEVEMIADTLEAEREMIQRMHDLLVENPDVDDEELYVKWNEE